MTDPMNFTQYFFKLDNRIFKHPFCGFVGHSCIFCEVSVPSLLPPCLSFYCAFVSICYVVWIQVLCQIYVLYFFPVHPWFVYSFSGWYLFRSWNFKFWWHPNLFFLIVLFIFCPWTLSPIPMSWSYGASF